MLLLTAISSVILALIFYATSIFQEFSQNRVSFGVLMFLWCGFVFDLTGTILMSLLSKGFSLNFHSIAGLTALLLMGGKAIWSSINYREGLGRRIPVVYTMVSGLVWLAVFFAGFYV